MIDYSRFWQGDQGPPGEPGERGIRVIQKVKKPAEKSVRRSANKKFALNM